MISGGVLVALVAILLPVTAAPGFVCVTLDWWPKTKCNYDECPWHRSSVWAIDLEEIKPYAEKLAPFLLRVGGTLQDFVEFVETDSECKSQFPVDPNARFGFGKGCITRSRIHAVSDFCRSVGCQLVWGLNGLQGRASNGTGGWDSSTSEKLLQFFHDIQAPLHAVTLGNEIWGQMINLTVNQAVDSFAELNDIVTRIWGFKETRPLIAGFDSFATDRIPYYRTILYQLSKQNVTLDVLNYHEYPLGSSNDPAVLHHALDPNLHKVVQARAQDARKVASHNNTSARQVWLSECGGSYNSGSLEATGTFASGFWYLDGMATTHREGHAHFCRQTLAGGFYGLLSNQSPRQPHADYWNALLYQNLMGTPVMLPSEQDSQRKCVDVGVPNANSRIHWYVHCGKQRENSLVVLGINYNEDLACRWDLSSLVQPNSTAMGYILTPSLDNVTSMDINLNGRLLRVGSGGEFPDLDGQPLNNNTLVLEPLTYGFFEIIGVSERCGCGIMEMAAF